MSHYSVEAIGHVRTCFPEKFGVPRQGLLAPSAKGTLVMRSDYADPDNFAGLGECSHLWLTFVFHHNQAQGWKSKVRPPRLGGNEKRGVFATRSPFRPNALGLSVVAFEGLEIDDHGVRLALSGVDLVDGTPVLDIKPYVPYCDAVSGAHNAMAVTAPRFVVVAFSEPAKADLRALGGAAASWQQLVVDVLQQDPRPAYQRHDAERVYKMSLSDRTLSWCYHETEHGETIEVLSLVERDPG